MSKPFSVNTSRFDPYKAFRFLVYFGNGTSPVAGVSKVGGLKRTSAPIEYKEGGNAIVLKGMGRTTYDAITLERGVTHDSDFQDWADAAQVLDKGSPNTSLKNLRRDIRIELLNEADSLCIDISFTAAGYLNIKHCPELDAGGTSVALEHIKLENEGWEKDKTLTEPTEI